MKLVTLRNVALLQINVSEMIKFQNSREDVFLKFFIFFNYSTCTILY